MTAYAPYRLHILMFLHCRRHCVFSLLFENNDLSIVGQKNRLVELAASDKGIGAGKNLIFRNFEEPVLFK